MILLIYSSHILARKLSSETLHKMLLCVAEMVYLYISRELFFALLKPTCNFERQHTEWNLGNFWWQHFVRKFFGRLCGRVSGTHSWNLVFTNDSPALFPQIRILTFLGQIATYLKHTPFQGTINTSVHVFRSKNNSRKEFSLGGGNILAGGN